MKFNQLFTNKHLNLTETTIEIIQDVSFIENKPKGFKEVFPGRAAGAFSGQIYSDYVAMDKKLKKFKDEMCIIDLDDGISIYFLEFMSGMVKITQADFWDSINDYDESGKSYADISSNAFVKADVMDWSKIESKI